MSHNKNEDLPLKDYKDTTNATDQKMDDSDKFGLLDLVPLIVFMLAAGFFGGAIYSTYFVAADDGGVNGALANLQYAVEPVSVEKLEDETQTFEIGGPSKTPVIVNFFASWCLPCKAEHPFLMKLSQQTDVPIIGIAFNEPRADTQQFIDDYGNPYTHIGIDKRAMVAGNFTLEGIPSTYILNAQGIMIWRRSGPIISTKPIIKALEEIQ